MALADRLGPFFLKKDFVVTCGILWEKVIGGVYMAEEAKKGNKALGCFTLIVILISVVTIMSMCSSGEPEAKDTDKTVNAWVMAQQFVEKQLKSPSTAKYPWGYKDYVTDLGNGKYSIRAYVDSENGFGAMLRTNFYCVVQNTEGDNWLCETLEFSE